MSYWTDPQVHVRASDGLVHWCGGPWLPHSRRRGYLICSIRDWDIERGDEIVEDAVTCLECLARSS